MKRFAGDDIGSDDESAQKKIKLENVQDMKRLLQLFKEEGTGKLMFGN